MNIKHLGNTLHEWIKNNIKDLYNTMKNFYIFT